MQHQKSIVLDAPVESVPAKRVGQLDSSEPSANWYRVFPEGMERLKIFDQFFGFKGKYAEDQDCGSHIVNYFLREFYRSASH